MNNKLLNITKYSALTIAMLSSTAQAISFSEGDWTMDINGIIGGYYTQTECELDANPSAWSTFSACAGAEDGQDTASVQNGFLPGWINFIATTTTDSGLDIKAHFGFSPGTSNPAAAGGQSARFAGAVAVNDVRNLYLSVTSDMGTIKIGRDAAIFQVDATFSDITVPSVGTQANTAGGLNTTFGAVATGYTFMSFQPQISYSSPVVNGLQGNIGVFQPLAIQANFAAPIYNVTDSPQLQGSVTYSIEGGSKLWASFVTQKAEMSKALGGKSMRAKGYELGGKLVLGGFTANLSGFKGDALGDGVMFLGALDAAGEAIETSGYLANVAYKFGANKLSAQYGVTENDDIDGAKNESFTLLYARDVSPGLLWTVEYTAHTTSQTGFGDAEANTISSGMLLFF
ncbi:MAG: hypothetical protein ACJAXJ_000520 [Colwellia sp.]|jgi:hypothetical protein|tara:strand:+ start:2240 stop:3439 length:1200 start_codon:yes stop_codon:yes gene_type:complete